MIEAVIIDFDDTMCLTEEASFNLENETLLQMGLRPMSRDVHKSTWGQVLYEAIQVRSPGIDPKIFFEVMPAVHEEFVSKGLIDVVTEENLQTLDKMAKAGKKLMILTSRTEIEMRHLLDPAHHLASRITTFYYKDNMTYLKPDPRAFEIIERDHGLKPDQCAYVGDSPGDAAAAKGAGLHFIASLESGLRTKQDFGQYPVDGFIEKFTDLYDAVVSLETA